MSVDNRQSARQRSRRPTRPSPEPKPAEPKHAASIATDDKRLRWRASTGPASAIGSGTTSGNYRARRRTVLLPPGARTISDVRVEMGVTGRLLLADLAVLWRPIVVVITPLLFLPLLLHLKTDVSMALFS